jgi:hypothetical protein
MLIAKNPIGTIGLVERTAATSAFNWSFTTMSVFSQRTLCKDGTVITMDHSHDSHEGEARNVMIERMNGDWILLLNDKYLVQPDLLFRLLNLITVTNADVAVAFHQQDRPPWAPKIFKIVNGTPLHLGGFPNMPIDIDAASDGPVLIKQSAAATMIREFNRMPFDPDPPHDGTVSFYRRLLKMKAKVVADPRVNAGAIVTDGVTLELFDRPGPPPAAVLQENAATC